MKLFDLVNIIFSTVVNLVLLTLALSPALIAIWQRRRKVRRERAMNLTQPTRWEH
ncbi:MULTISPECIES: hypothetical protein [Arthrobacter]|uniref:hypothetical protein n=1 Tax=Arthrobacter TaxID=1663 RepID=UPI001404AA6E|nr:MULTISPECIES: hypothetical protein [Arthrobacter]MBT8161425.1 hypothetical protein [Arthrobacter sp. GN70]